MRKFLSLFALLATLPVLPAAAHIAAPATEQVAPAPSPAEPANRGTERFVAPDAGGIPQVKAIASFGPFRVIDANSAALVDETDSASPAQFQAMLRAYPGLRRIEIIECPGTVDDVANLKLGRLIRRKGLETHVPANGSARSGGVELFLAGAKRSADEGAEFAVHSWKDENGREARDVPASDPVNRTYLTYYQDMGLTREQAAAFYAMTNSVPNDSALWLGRADMARYVPLQ